LHGGGQGHKATNQNRLGVRHLQRPDAFWVQITSNFNSLRRAVDRKSVIFYPLSVCIQSAPSDPMQIRPLSKAAVQLASHHALPCRLPARRFPRCRPRCRFPPRFPRAGRKAVPAHRTFVSCPPRSL
jgi:hypothetical protein